MPSDLKEKYSILLKDPYLWMIRGVIGLAGVLYTPWMFAVLPIGEVLSLTWFDELFKDKVEQQREKSLEREKEKLLKLLSEKDKKWYGRVALYIEQVKKHLTHPAYRQQVDFDELSLAFIKKLILLRKAEAAERYMPEETMIHEIAELEKALKRETNTKVQAALAERLALQKQRLELKNRVGAKIREMEVQLKLIEDQILHLRDQAISSHIQDEADLEAGSRLPGSDLIERVTDLSRQLQISSELAEEMQAMLEDPSHPQFMKK